MAEYSDAQRTATKKDGVGSLGAGAEWVSRVSRWTEQMCETQSDRDWSQEALEKLRGREHKPLALLGRKLLKPEV